MKTIQEEWESYLKNVLPIDAPPIQVEETRRGFYAGVWAIMQLQFNMPTNISETDELVMLESWMDECLTFLEQLKKGNN